jgi:dolichol-phosphate mannosyltransferase
MNPGGPCAVVAEVARVSVILPTYNERESLELIYPSLTAALLPLRSEILVVDDHSPDGTAEFARGLHGPVPTTVIERPRKLGLASAVLDGIARARGEIIVVMDADGSHPPETVPALVAALDAGAEFALGSRWVAGGSGRGLSRPRQLISSGARVLARPVARVRDPMSGFFAFRRTILGRAPLWPIGYKIGLEILVKCRPEPIVEIPLDFRPRVAGVSKLGGGEIGNYIRHVTQLYFWRFVWSRRASSTR